MKPYNLRIVATDQDAALETCARYGYEVLGEPREVTRNRGGLCVYEVPVTLGV